MPQYKITGSRLGGEHIIGSIDYQVGEYWLDRGKGALEAYMLDESEDRDNDVPEEARIPVWYDCDDVLHVSGVELAPENQLEIEDLSTNEVELISLDIDLNDPNLEIVEFDQPEDTYLLNSQSFEKGTWGFDELDIDEPFDHKKLKIKAQAWGDLLIVTELNYEDQTLTVTDIDTMRKSQAAWIDD